MIKDEGKVISLQDGVAKILIDSKPACHSCKLCGRGGDENMIMEVKVNSGISAGDPVEIEIEGRSLLFCFFMLYLFPVICFVAGILAGMSAAEIFSLKEFKEPLEIVSGFLFLSVSLYLIRKFDKEYKNKDIIKVKKRTE